MDSWESSYVTADGQATTSRTLVFQGGVSASSGFGRASGVSASFECEAVPHHTQTVEVRCNYNWSRMI